MPPPAPLPLPMMSNSFAMGGYRSIVGTGFAPVVWSWIAQTESDEQMKRMLLSRPPKVRFAVCWQLDFTDHFSLGVENMNAVERAGIHVSHRVQPHAVGKTRRDDRELALVGDRRAIRRDIECVDGVRLFVMVSAGCLDGAAIDNIEGFFVR